jgi:hypothetical protein
MAQWENPLGVFLRNFAFRLLPKLVKEKQMDKVFRTDF